MTKRSMQSAPVVRSHREFYPILVPTSIGCTPFVKLDGLTLKQSSGIHGKLHHRNHRGKSGRIRARPHHAMEVELDLPIDHPSYPFDQGGRFVIGLAPSLDLGQRRARKDRKRALVNDLVARVELRDDEVDGGPMGPPRGLEGA